ncbi:hypothetical protein AAF712_007886 [Marasmius tenuissimus]|uniref:Uncharacterized protein n=1 Tax=Marasmius tenuissimus TaxID=585030 RepID=A0ABR2ZTY8_9AGAR
MLSPNSEPTLDHANEREPATSTARTLNIPKPFGALFGRPSSPSMMPTLTTTHGKMSSSQANDLRENTALARSLSSTETSPESPSRTDTSSISPPNGPDNVSRSSSIMKSRTPSPGPELNSVHLTPSRISQSPTPSIRSHDLQSIPTISSRATSRDSRSTSSGSDSSSDEEEVYFNGLLTHILDDRTFLVGIIAHTEWPDFLALTQTCRGARRAVLDLNENESSLTQSGRSTSRSSQSSARSVQMSAPVRDEVLIGYVEGYSYLARRIKRATARRNALDKLTSRTQPTRAVVSRGRQAQSQSKTSVTNIQKTGKTADFKTAKTIKTSLEEIQLLYISSLTPLHVYPTSALVSLSTSSRTRSSDNLETRFTDVTRKLQALTLAHSKFVLLLRTMADQVEELRSSNSRFKPPARHTNGSPRQMPSDQQMRLDTDSEHEREEDLFDTHTYIRGGTFDHPNLPRGSPHSRVRELVFPAPLAGSSPQSSESRNSQQDASIEPVHSRFTSDSAVTSSRSKHSKAPLSRNTAPSAFRSSPQSPKASSLATPRSSLDSVTASPTKRLSILKAKTPLISPPLPSEPQTLKAYSTGWRRSLLIASVNHQKRVHRRSTLNLRQEPDEFGVEDLTWTPSTPRKRFTTSPAKQPRPLPLSPSGSDTSNTSSANSSRRNSGNYSSENSSPSPERRDSDGAKRKEVESPKKNISFQLEERAAKRLSTLNKLNGSGALTRPGTLKSPHSRITSHPSQTATSPHDLLLATSRLRAPVLRVYVPCSELSRSSSFKEGITPYAASSSSRPASRPSTASLRSEQTSSVQQVEAELMRAGVWEWMRGGEVVVNFGYMPGVFTTVAPKPARPTLSRRQSQTTVRESQIFANFTPSPPGTIPVASPRALRTNVKSNSRAAGRFAEYSGSGSDASSPPSSFRSPTSTPGGTPGPSRVSSSTSITNSASLVSQPSQSTIQARPSSRQSTLDSRQYTSSPVPLRQPAFVQEPSPQQVEATWLIFNGSHLVPYTPSTSDAEALSHEDGLERLAKREESFLPLDDPLALPSPFYYDHILGAEGRLKVRVDSSRIPKPLDSEKVNVTTMSHTRSRSDPSSRDASGEFGSHFHEEFFNLGHSSEDDSGSAGISMSLQTFPALIHSPGGLGGWAKVRRWRWVARATIPSPTTTEVEEPSHPPTTFRTSSTATRSNWLSTGGRASYEKERELKGLIGRGWTGRTWVLEGEGTKEGRDVLLSCLKSSSASLPPAEGVNSTKMEWEIVRAKTDKAGPTAGVLWFRLLTPSAPVGSLDGDDSTIGC